MLDQRTGDDIGGGGGIGIDPVGAAIFPPPLVLGPSSAAPTDETGPDIPGWKLPPPLTLGPGATTGGRAVIAAGAGRVSSRCNSCPLSWLATLSVGDAAGALLLTLASLLTLATLREVVLRACIGRCGL
jgi:hypothetical protein